MRNHFVIYLGSRSIAAAMNLVAVAIFARLAGPDIYGSYLLIAASANVVFGFTAQWASAAFFALYAEHESEGQIASLLAVIATLLGIFVLGVAGAALLGGVKAPFIAALVAMASGAALLEAATEIARTRLEPTKVAVALLLRAFGSLSVGALALVLFHSATALALGVASANVVAAMPSLFRFLPSLWRKSTIEGIVQLFHYGWPLILAFGVSALGQNIDRLLLGTWIGPRELGPYGAISDLIKQTYFVVGEAITLAFISIAKRAEADGDHAGALDVLQIAFTSLVAVVGFGAGFFLCFGPELFDLVFGARFAGIPNSYYPILVAGNALLTLRSFYFAQVIYFSKSSGLELWVACLALAVSFGLGVLLIPRIGVTGAAISLLCAQALACAAFAIAGRRAYHMPTPLGRSLAILGVVAAFLIAAAIVDALSLPFLATQAINATLFVAAGLFAVFRFHLFGFNPAILFASFRGE